MNHSEHLIDGYGPTWYAGHNVVDGIYNPLDVGSNIYYSLTTLFTANSWMVIDLQSVFCVEAVKIWPRMISDPNSKCASKLDNP